MAILKRSLPPPIRLMESGGIMKAIFHGNGKEAIDYESISLKRNI
jgi:hypothetical protein